MKSNQNLTKINEGMDVEEQTIKFSDEMTLKLDGDDGILDFFLYLTNLI